MIRLTATLINIDGGYAYVIEGEALGLPRTAMTSPEASVILTELGVMGAARLVAHAESWGAVDIHEHDTRHDPDTRD